MITAVSNALRDALEQKFFIKKIICIPNVVDTDIFYPIEKNEINDQKVFLHVSTLTPQKNPEQILKAFTLLKYQFHEDFRLWIVGPYLQSLVDLSKYLNINENIIWHKETSQQNLASMMRKADALILYSRFESFGCVNIEAMACGLPVIVSDLPVFREYLQDGITALFVNSENLDQLTLTLYTFINSPRIPPEVISPNAQRFNYKIVGKQILDMYNEVLSN